MPKQVLAIPENRNCHVCDSRTSGFNYGVQSCNSCKMFFRRALDSDRVFTCRSSNNSGQCTSTKCRFCRFHKCIRVGMKFLEDSTMERTLFELKEQDNIRRNTFLNEMTSAEVIFTDIFERRNFKFIKKSMEMNMDFYEWGVMNHLTCITFFTKLSFTKYLSIDDLKSVIKCSHLMYMILVTAMRSYSSKMAVMCHPDGSDIFPEEVRQVTGYNPIMLNEIRSFLINRLIELRVTEEEFLLLGAMMLCNTAVPNLSESGQILLDSNRIKYQSTLFRYCRLQYGEDAAPSRFNNIISLWHAVIKTQSDIDKFSALFPIVQPHDVKENLFTEILRFLLS